MYAAGKAPLRADVGSNSAGSESRASMLQYASFLCAPCQKLQSYLLFWQRGRSTLHHHRLSASETRFCTWRLRVPQCLLGSILPIQSLSRARNACDPTSTPLWSRSV